MHEEHLGHARIQMPIVKMPSFLVGRKERTGSWADAGEAAGTDSQLRRDMERVKSEQEKVEQELRELWEEQRKRRANKSSTQQEQRRRWTFS